MVARSYISYHEAKPRCRVEHFVANEEALSRIWIQNIAARRGRGDSCELRQGRQAYKTQIDAQVSRDIDRSLNGGKAIEHCSQLILAGASRVQTVRTVLPRLGLASVIEADGCAYGKLSVSVANRARDHGGHRWPSQKKDGRK
jgi:hypothetical protein